MADSFWKIMAKKRREQRQAPAESEVPRHKRRKPKRKRYTVEMKRRPEQKCWFSWHKEWSCHGKYETLKSAKQAMRSLKKDRLWGEYLHRIVDDGTGQVLVTNEEEMPDE